MFRDELFIKAKENPMKLSFFNKVSINFLIQAVFLVWRGTKWPAAIHHPKVINSCMSLTLNYVNAYPE